MSVLMSGGTSDALAPASTISITGFPFSTSRWIQCPENAVKIYSSRVQLIWSDAADVSAYYVELHCQAGTTTGKVRPRVERSALGGQIYDPLYDDTFNELEAAHICEVFNAADDAELWVNGVLVDTSSTSKNFFGGSGAILDDLFIGGKDPAVGEKAFSGYLQDVAIWDGVALGSTQITQLQNYWADTIPTAPDWSWRLSSNLNANAGGINLTDVGTTSYSVETDIVSLSTYSAPSSGVAGIILGGG